jgi:hypothetical protein
MKNGGTSLVRHSIIQQVGMVRRRITQLIHRDERFGEAAKGANMSNQQQTNGVGSTSSAAVQELLDTVAIQQLILKWASARDMKAWEARASCFTEDSVVEMSWFRGSGAVFAAEVKKIAATGLLTFHEIGPSSIQIVQDRAIADSPMAAHVVRELGGADVDITFWTRMRSRAERHGGRWLLSGLRVIYIHDLILPRTPSVIPTLDTDLLATFRSTYKYLSYALSTSGHPIADDLPGFDKPETVQALISAEEEWLHSGTK